MEHLLTDHGYEDVLYLSGPKNNTDSNERERAYREAMKAHDIEVTEDMVEYGDYSSNVDELVEKLVSEFKINKKNIKVEDKLKNKKKK